MAPPALPQLLEQLSELLGRMCTEAATSLRGAGAGLLDGRLRLAEKIVASDVMGELRAGVENVATDALLFHAPVAGDLRTVVSAIRASGDLERMDVLARHVAEAALRRQSRCAVPEQVRPAFTEMNRLGVEMALKAAEVVRTRNVLLAVELDADDEAMDDLHAQLFGVLMDRSWPHGIAAAVDVTLLGRYYERFADHAVLVADETVTAVTGRRPREVAEFLLAQRSATG
ncbi:phosphate signaling complex PhoU family protein [Pseudonocardia charpentierae]|uniref:PhoU domain-containing protein n=1 Tax=Pseudonocardia charpentierae TaxID=3075545 RepID=A0ABU2N1X8_9PSEU|nr:PhoU domain-containing protein [Pseudonocardia sp. DSM 45834]MDT0347915.1 PhoU domain-containing protein [Pseudonocardia sp. DSM 45834]